MILSVPRQKINSRKAKRLSKTCKIKPAEIYAAASRGVPSFQSDVQKEFKSLMDEFKTMLGKHSMLSLVDWNKVGAKDITMVIDYVNFVATK